MGLGPAVCQHCGVLAEFVDPPVPVIRNSNTRTVSEWTRWVCPVCGETDPQDYGFDFDKYERNLKVHMDNKKLLKFLDGEEPNASTST